MPLEIMDLLIRCFKGQVGTFIATGGLRWEVVGNPILHPIQDDINIYIGYTLMMSHVVRKVMDTMNAQNINIYPFQIDLVICGRRQQLEHDFEIAEDSSDSEDDDDDEEDDDDDDLMSNQLPRDGIAKMLERAKIESDSHPISLIEEGQSVRTVREMVLKKLGIVHILYGTYS